ncbi:MAG: iron-sulfur cluster assembly scaffold protein [Desulfobacterales bacterium]|jgi:nitrogen fixation protein NifU and related proteins|nr:iron-sulfur cluster assembly scaffold protein [Desulfobacteraceae bacterium]MBT4364891.1 iron-sulfur cluster assembly scaffold protein [Desulfobacteraceae bacterium]MBT7086215.1 iron-sulfur cluster assembly scaffold protein [Desulfobacterales bacterium]
MKEKDIESTIKHSKNYLEMALRNDRRTRINKPDGYGKRTGECGDTIEMFLSVFEGYIDRVFFETDGCMNTAACSNTVAYLAEGKTVDDAWKIMAEDIIDYLETLPVEEAHCAELAAGAFYLALSDYRETRKAPWKKIYRNN